MTQQMRDMENRKLGREEGLIEGKKAGIQETVSLLAQIKAKDISMEEAARRLDISVEEIRKMLA